MNDNISSMTIGGQIRRMRLALGLSMKELSRRAGTSAPALHRYESGWDRFEIATLRRIAVALGARLEVGLHPANPRHSSTRPAKKQLLRLLAPLFWDTPLTAATLTEHPRWVLGRVLSYGNLDQARAARQFYGDDAIRVAIAQRGIDKRTSNYWSTIIEDHHAPEGIEHRGLEHRP